MLQIVYFFDFRRHFQSFIKVVVSQIFPELTTLLNVSWAHPRKPDMGKLLKGEEGFLPVDVDPLEPTLVLGLVDPGGGQGRDAHPVADEDDHVLGQFGVDLTQDVQRVLDLILSHLLPVVGAWLKFTKIIWPLKGTDLNNFTDSFFKEKFTDLLSL